MSGGKKRSGFQITSVTSEVEESSGPNPGPDADDSSPALSRSTDQAIPSPIVLNGPAFHHTFSPALFTQQSSSQPTTPVTIRKQRSLDQAGGGASRFRVVRLGQGLGEPYRRGRWTCVDVLEREAELRGVRRVMDSLRHAHSLESLETVGLGGAEAVLDRVMLKPLSIRGFCPGLTVHSQGSAHPVARSSPPSPTHTHQEAHPTSPPAHTPSAPHGRKIPPPLRLDVDTAMLRAAHSQPASPGPPTSRDGSLPPSLAPIQTPSALALAQSMFGVGGAFELVGDDSGSSNSTVAIDNKIEQAMDLVKAHLMLAVREEVELLREQIKELTERNAQLERENSILRALRD